MAGNRRINQNQITLNVSPNVITAASLAGGTLIKAYSPTVTATEVDDGFQITITDVNGTRTIMVHHGYQGEQGDKGDPGFSPEVSLTATDSGVNMTIADESGEHTILIPKGDKGDPGMSPIIQDGYWYLYDNTTNQYINSQIPVQIEYQFDNEPTDNSDSLLTSGAVYTALESKADVADVPTKVSDLDNDAGYLTQHQDISGKANIADVPTKVSDLDNDSGFISSYTETDPTVPAWAKTPTKPTYTASEVGALPSNTVIPSKVSDLTNDAGYLTSHQDISGKADASDIPTKLSDLTNDVGFITSYTEIDPTVPAWARAATKPSYTAQEVGALPDSTVIPTKVSDLTNDAGYLTAHQDISGKADIADVPTKVSDLVDDSGHYTKPSGGIPASDLASGVIPDLTNYVQNTDYISDNDYGIARTNASLGITANSSGIIRTSPATSAQIKTGTESYKPISPVRQHEAIFYGLAKAAGDMTQAESSNAVGTYTDDAKTAIRNMLDAVSDTDYASDSTFGILKTNGSNGITAGNGVARISPATDTHIKAGTAMYKPIAPYRQHEAVFYGLAKAAGDTTQSQSDNVVGTYTNDAKDKIQQMLGIDNLIAQHEDYATATNAISTNKLFMMSGKLYNATANIAANGTITPGTNCEEVSIDSAFVKKTDYATSSTCGVVKSGGRLEVDSSGKLNVRMASDNNIKGGTTNDVVITPGGAHMSAFYGLAKAAGDTTQATSSNAVGTYTENAKNAIKAMLDVGTLPETVTGSTPSITATANHRYICGEVTSLNFTPCPSGMCDVRFTSGSTVTVLTVPNTVKWPGWFDPTSLETNTVYEINIEDGVYGVVMTWPV